MTQDPETILRNRAAYVSKHLRRVPGFNPEQIVAEQITEGTRKRVSDVGVFALQVAQGFINCGIKSNVAIDRVQFKNQRRRAKVEIGREFVGRGWIIEERPQQWVKESTDTNVGDYSTSKYVPAYWQPVSGSCLLQDGTIGVYTGYPPRGSGRSLLSFE